LGKGGGRERKNQRLFSKRGKKRNLLHFFRVGGKKEEVNGVLAKGVRQTYRGKKKKKRKELTLENKGKGSRALFIIRGKEKDIYQSTYYIGKEGTLGRGGKTLLHSLGGKGEGEKAKLLIGKEGDRRESGEGGNCFRKKKGGEVRRPKETKKRESKTRGRIFSKERGEKSNSRGLR